LITFNTHARELLYKATFPTQILFEMEHMPTIERDERRGEAGRVEEKEGGGGEKTHVQA
jgi:hypothetical protein